MSFGSPGPGADQVDDAGRSGRRGVFQQPADQPFAQLVGLGPRGRAPRPPSCPARPPTGTRVRRCRGGTAGSPGARRAGRRAPPPIPRRTSPRAAGGAASRAPGDAPPVEMARTSSPRRTIEGAAQSQFGMSSMTFTRTPRSRASRATAARSAGSSDEATHTNAPSRSAGRHARRSTVTRSSSAASDSRRAAGRSAMTVTGSDVGGQQSLDLALADRRLADHDRVPPGELQEHRVAERHRYDAASVV